MAKRFAGKNVIVTGASAGIGAATLRAFAREGANVVAVARTESKLEELVVELRSEGLSAMAVAVDVGDLSSVQRMLERVASELGGIDILVNNAATNHRGPFESISVAQLSEVIAINLTAPATLMRLVLPYLKKRGEGAIVNVASLAGRVPLIYEAIYSATKFALRGMSFAVADELADSGVTVSVVSPGPVSTGFIMLDMDSVSDVVFSMPMSTPEDIASLILACAHDGKLERTPSLHVRLTSTIGYLFPALRRLTTPLMQRRGRAIKDGYRRRQLPAS